MKFGTFLLRVNDAREASLKDFIDVCELGIRIYNPERQKYLYVIEKELIDNRFFWLSCDYGDAKSFTNYVVNQDTKEQEPNPRNRSQVEPQKQFFACYDIDTHFLYINDLNRRNTLTSYLSDSIQKKFVCNNVYTSVDEFCQRVKSIRGFHYLQVNNLITQKSDIFSQIGDIYGLDTPEQVKLKITYGDIPVHKCRHLIERFYSKKSEFENVVIIGCDDQGVESTFDFSSIIKRIEISPNKDDNGHFNPVEVRQLLLNELRL